MSKNYDPNFVPKYTYFIVGGKAIVKKGSEILLLQRSEKSGGGGKWSLHGGALEKEDAVDGIKREIDEEISVEVGKIKPFSVKTYFDKKPTVIVGYICDYVSGEIELNWEHDDYKWLLPEDALEYPLTPDGKYFIDNYIRRLKNEI